MRLREEGTMKTPFNVYLVDADSCIILSSYLCHSPSNGSYYSLSFLLTKSTSLAALVLLLFYHLLSLRISFFTLFSFS